MMATRKMAACRDCGHPYRSDGGLVHHVAFGPREDGRLYRCGICSVHCSGQVQVPHG